MKFGFLPSENSVTDNSFTDIQSNIKKFASSSSNEHLIQEYTPVSNQLNLGSCVANATVDALEILMGLSGKPIQLSRLFVYWNARLYDKSTDKDEGTFIRNAFNSLAKDGVCPESVWEYNTNKVFAQPPMEAYRQGLDNTIHSFYRINATGDKRIEEIESAIRANHPVVFGTGVTDSFLRYAYSNTDKIWTAPTDKIVGLHAMIVTGVKEVNNNLQFYIRNSWGTDWGRSGHTWFDQSYFLHPTTSDIWVPTLMPNLL